MSEQINKDEAMGFMLDFLTQHAAQFGAENAELCKTDYCTFAAKLSDEMQRVYNGLNRED